MRAVYREPKELATCLKDLVDNYLENLIEYEVLETKIKKIVAANEERLYKEKSMMPKISRYLDKEQISIINKIANKNI